MVGIVAGSNWGLKNSSLNVLGANGLFGQAQLGSNGQRTYIDVASGSLIIQQRDEFVSSAGRDLNFNRTYTSGSSYAGYRYDGYQDSNEDLWQMLPISKLERQGAVNNAGSSLVLVDTDGSRTTFNYDATRSAYVTTDGGGAYSTISYTASTQEYTLQHGESAELGNVDVYNASGALVRSSDTSGVNTTYTWEAGRLMVTDATGDAEYFNFTNGQLTSITERPAGSTAELTRVHYDYDDLHRLSGVTTYLFAETGNESAYTTTYTYLDDTLNVTSIYQNDGTNVHYEYNAQGQVWKVIDAYGSVTTFSYGTNSTTVTDPYGRSTVYTFEDNGTGGYYEGSTGRRLTSVTTPAVNGVTQTTRYFYDAKGNVARIVAPSGLETTFEYDANGNCTLQRDAAGNTVTRRYDPQTNRLLTQTTYRTPDPDSAGAGQPGVPETEYFVYDARGNLRFHVSPSGAVQEYRYDERSQQKSAITYNIGRFTLTGYSATVAPTETTLGNWVNSTSSQRSSSTRVDFGYDARGLRNSVTSYNAVDANGDGIRTAGTFAVETYHYDQFGSLLQKVDGNNNLTSYRYDALGRFWHSTDAAGQEVTHDYDSENINTYYSAGGVQIDGVQGYSSIDANGGVDHDLLADWRGGNTVAQGIAYSYDRLNRVQLAFNNGADTWYLYDEASRKVGEVDATGTVTEYIYDIDSRIVATRVYATRAQSAAARGYAALDSLSLASVRPAASLNDRVTRYAYDNAGRVSRQLDADGYLTTYQYDGESQLVAEIRYATAVASIDSTPAASADDRIVRSFYDMDGHLTGRIDGDGYATEWRYNAGGQLTDTIRYATQIAVAARTAFNPATSAKDIRERVFYNAKGQVIGTLDGENYFTARSYDRAGNLATTRRYAAVAQAPTAATVDALGVPPGPNDQVTIYTSTVLNQLETVTAPDGAVTRYGYDSFGSVISIVRNASDAFGNRSTTRHVDAFGHVIEELGGEGSLQLAASSAPDTVWTTQATHNAYDERGRLVASTDADGHRTLFFYDAEDREVMRVNGAGDVEETRYNAFGDVEQKIFRNVSLTGSQLNTLAQSATTLSPAARTATALGMSNALARADERIQNFRYDHRGELVDQWEGTASQAVDQVNGIGYHTLATYDAFGDLLTQAQQNTAGSGYMTTRYTYDHRGNRLTTTPFLKPTLMSTAVFDAFGRLTSTTDANGHTTTTDYDRLGRAITLKDSTAGTKGTRTSYDAFNRVLTQTDPLDAVTTYAYDTKARTMTVTTPEGVVHKTTRNAFGETVSILDAAGAGPTYSYDRDGHLLRVTDSIGQATLNSYDKAGFLATPTDGAGHLTTFTYDAAGRLFTRSVDPEPALLDAGSPGDPPPPPSGGLDGGAGGANLTSASTTVVKGGKTMELVGSTDAAISVGETPGTPTPPPPEPVPHLNLVTTYTYDAQGRVLTVTGPDGKVTETRYDRKGQVASVTEDLYGKKLATSFSYDSRGNQVRVTDPGGIVTSYEFSENGFNTAAVVDPGGLALRTSAVYDNTGRNIVLRTDSGGRVTRLAYNENDQLVWQLGPDGRVTEYSYDADQRLVRTTQYARPSALITAATPADAVFSADQIKNSVTADAAHDLTSRTVYDKDGRVYASIDGAGTLTVNLAFDSAGRVTDQVTYATALTAAQIASLSTRDAVRTWVTGGTLAKPALDAHTRAFYDVRGQLTLSLKAGGLTSTGLVRWSVTRMGYDGAGNLVSQDTPATTYDSNAPAEAAVLAWLPGASNQADGTSRVRMIYDAANRLAATATASTRDAFGFTSWSIVTQDYDRGGRVTFRRAYANPLRTSGEPDVAAFLRAGANLSSTDHQERYAYDTAGRLTGTAVFQGMQNGQERWALTRLTLDNDGNVRTSTRYATALTSSDQMKGVVDATGAQVTAYSYDKANRLVLTQDPAGALTGLVYDAAGNVAARVQYADTVLVNGLPRPSSADRISYALYDKAGRPTLQIAADGAVTAFDYDALGHVLSTRQYAVRADLAGLTTQADAATLKQRVTASSQDRVVQYAYDASGQLTYQLDAVGYLTYYVHDALGNVTDQVAYVNKPAVTVDAGKFLGVTLPAPHPLDRGTHYDYDGQGRLTASSDVEGTEQYGYDALGHRTSLKNKAGQTWTYKYTAAGQLASETAPQVDVVEGRLTTEGGKITVGITAGRTSLVTTYTYDLFGNVAIRTESDGVAAGRQTSYTYDAANRQIRTEYPAVAAYDTSEAPLNVAPNTDAPRTERPAVRPFTTVTYDIFGNAVAGTDLAGNTSYKVYDAANRVRFEVDAKGYITGHSYNTFGDEIATTRFGQTTALTAADRASATRVQSLLNNLGHGADRVLEMQYDKAGRKILVKEPSAYTFDSATGTYADLARTAAMTYSAFGEVLSRKVYGTANGQQAGPAQATYSFYNIRGLLETEAQVVGEQGNNLDVYVTDHTYDAAGNLESTTEYADKVTVTRASLEQDRTQPAVTVNAGYDHTISWKYDKLNRKVSETREHVQYENAAQQLTTGNVTTTFAYDHLGNQTLVTDAAGNQTYTYYDALGRVTATATLHPDSTRAPLTVFRRNVYGDIVQRIDYGYGAATADASGYTIATRRTGEADVADRVSGNIFDSAGHVTVSVDAEGHTINTSYDLAGRVAKIWQRVTDANGTFRNAFQITHYDALGNVVQIDTPTVANAADGGAAQAMSLKMTEYNQFGEVRYRLYKESTDPAIAKTYVINEYDNAGNLWRSNDGDGIDKVQLYDVFGNATATLTSTDPDHPHLFATLASAKDAVTQALVARTETRYDLLGHVLDQRQVDTAVQVLERDERDNWIAVPRKAGNVQLNSLVVVGGADDAGSVVTLQFRQQGSAEWITATGDRLKNVDGYIVFSTSGLAGGSWEYKVSVQHPGSPAFDRSSGVLAITSAETTGKARELARLYVAILGRLPDVTGLNFYLARLNAGATLTEVAKSMLDSDEAKALWYTDLSHPGTEVGQIVAEALGGHVTDPAIYPVATEVSTRYNTPGSDPDLGPAQVMVDFLDDLWNYAGTDPLKAAASRVYHARVDAAMVYAVTYSGDKVATAKTLYADAAVKDVSVVLANARAVAIEEIGKAQLAQLYVMLFGRAPDVTGMAYYLDKLKAGATIEAVAQGMLSDPSAEPASLYPSTGLTPAQYNAQLVSHVYQNALGRDPSANELARWTDKLNGSAGTPPINPGTFLLQFAQEVSNYTGADTTRLAERSVFNNRVSIGAKFAELGVNLSADPSHNLELSRKLIAAVQRAEDPFSAALAAALHFREEGNSVDPVAAGANAAAQAQSLEALRTDLARLYLAVFNRVPDSTGFSFYMWKETEKSATPLQIVQDMLDGQESRSGAGANYVLVNGTPVLRSSREFVDQVYRQILGYLPSGDVLVQDRIDLAAALDQGTQSRAQAVLSIIDKVQRGRGMGPTDLAARAKFENKAAVGVAFAVDLVCEDVATARTVAAMVTDTNIADALTYAYQRAQQLAAQAAQATAADARAGATVVLQDAQKLDAMLQAYAAEVAAKGAAAVVPTALYRLQVMQMYLVLLGREPSSFLTLPDLDGIGFYVNNLAAGISTPLSVVQALLDDTEGRTKLPPSLSSTAFVTTLYQRMGFSDAGPIAAQVYRLDHDHVSRAQVALDVMAEVLNASTPDATPQNVSVQLNRTWFLGRVAQALNIVETEASTKQAATDRELALQRQNKADAERLLASLPSSPGEADRDKADAAALLASADSASGGLATRRIMVIRMMNLFQGRTTPTLAQVDAYAASGSSLQSIAESMIAAIPGFPPAGSSNVQVVNALYQRIFDRLPDPGDTWWVDKMATGITRSDAAVGMILDLEDHFTDSLVGELTRKKSLDQVILGALNGLVQTATTTKGTAQSAYDSAKIAYDAADRAYSNATDDLRYWDGRMDSTQSGWDHARCVQSAGGRGELSYINLILGGGTDFESLYASLTAGTTGESRLRAWVAAQGGSNEAFLDAVYGTALLRAPDAEGFAFYLDKLKIGETRWTVANDIFHSNEAMNTTWATAFPALVAEQNRAMDAAIEAHEDAADGWVAAYQEVNRTYGVRQNALGSYSNTRAALDTATADLARLQALVTFENKLIEADQSFLDDGPVREAQAKLDAANARIPQLASDSEKYARISAAETAASNLADASTLSAADTWAVLNGRLMPIPVSVAQVRTIVQLFTTLLGHGPSVSEVQYWRREMATGRTAADVALGLMDSADARARHLFDNPTATSLLQTLYVNGLGHNADSAGLAYWSAKLVGQARADYALLAAQFTESLTMQMQVDTVTFDNRIKLAFDTLATAADAVGTAPDLHDAIGAADLAALRAAIDFDAGLQDQMNQVAKDALTVTRLYVGLFNRAPSGELLLALASPPVLGQRTELQIAQAILDLPEARAAYPSVLQPAEQCSRLFFAINGRQPSDAELAGTIATYNRGGLAQAALDLATALTSRSSSDLFDDAWRDLSDARVKRALQEATASLLDIKTDDTTLSDTAFEIAIAVPAEVHPQTVMAGRDATLTGGSVLDLRPNQFSVDRWGNVLSVLDPRDPAWATSYRYDASNHVVAVQHPVIPGDPVATGTGEASRYDILGRMTLSTDARGNSNRVTYDANNYVVKESYADGYAATYVVDVFGDRLAVTQGNGVTFTYTYDNLGHQVSRTSGSTWIYWARNENASSQSSDMAVQSRQGQVVDKYTYDEFGRRIHSTTTDTTDLVTDNKVIGTRTFYDLDGNVVKTTNELGQFATRSYFDAFGHETKQVDGAGGILTWDTDEFGQVESHTDLGGHKTTYAYDGSGRLTRMSTSGTGADISYTYNSKGQLLTQYDGALKKVSYYRYDAAGNRVSERLLQESISGGGTRPDVAREFLQDQRMTFDQQGRMTDIQSFAPKGIATVHYEYDGNGNRLKQNTRYRDSVGLYTTVDVTNTFDAMNRQLTVDSVTTPTGIAGAPPAVKHAKHTLTYDGAGNRQSDLDELTRRTENYTYDNLGRLSNISEITLVNGREQSKMLGFRDYDAAGHVIVSLDGNDRRVNNYDGSGHVLRTRVTDNAGNYKYDVFYTDKENHSAYDGAGNLQFYSTVASDKRSQETVFKYDFAGGLFDTRKQTTLTATPASGTAATTISTYDANGNLAATRQPGDAFHDSSFVTDAQGHILEKNGPDGIVRTLIVNGQVIGSNDKDSNTFTGEFEEYTSPALSASPTAYTVQSDGESLQSIAKAVWGDATLWYLISEANGGLSNTGLKANQPLILPARVNTVHNSAGTFRPYDASAAIGDTTPVLPPPAAQSSSGGGGCGVFGKIISIAIAIAVTVTLGPQMIAALGTIGGGAAAAAAGSLASQTFNIATGMQNGFDWKGVAMAAVSGGVSGGVSQIPGLSGDAWQMVAARAAVSNVASQGIAIMTNMQHGFNWRSVAAASAGAAVGSLTKMPSSGEFDKFAKASLSSFAAGATTAVLKGGHISVVQIATDAFGNALGQSLASQSTSAGGTSSGSVNFVATVKGRSIANAFASRGDTPIGSTGPTPGETFEQAQARYAVDDYFRKQDAAAGSLASWAVNLPSSLQGVEPSLYYDQTVLASADHPNADGTSFHGIRVTNAVHRMTSEQALEYDQTMYAAEQYRLALSENEASNTANAAYYALRENTAANWFTQKAWHVAGVASESAHNIAGTVRSLPLLMDSDVRSVAGRNLVDTWNHLPSVLKNKGDAFMAQDAQGKVDSLLKFGFESAAGLGAGKAVGYAVDSAVTGVKWARNFKDSLSALDGLNRNPYTGDTWVPTLGGPNVVAADVAASAAQEYGVAFFGADNYAKYYSSPNVLIGAPGGTPFFFMPLEDSAVVTNSADAARYTGMAPSAQKAYVNGGDIYGISFPTEGMSPRLPTAADAGGWPHFLDGGNTAVKLEGPNAGYLLNPVRERVVPGGSPAPKGSVIFKLGPDGEWIPIRRF